MGDDRKRATASWIASTGWLVRGCWGPTGIKLLLQDLDVGNQLVQGHEVTAGLVEARVAEVVLELGEAILVSAHRNRLDRVHRA